jgi:hypothetical protein
LPFIPRFLKYHNTTTLEGNPALITRQQQNGLGDAFLRAGLS